MRPADACQNRDALSLFLLRVALYPPARHKRADRLIIKKVFLFVFFLKLILPSIVQVINVWRYVSGTTTGSVPIHLFALELIKNVEF